MRTLIALFTLAALSGCALQERWESLTPPQKRFVGFIGVVIGAGAYAAYKADHGAMETSNAPLAIGKPLACSPQPDGSCR